MSFITCEKCGKKLIERLPNGLWRFRFGRKPGNEKAVVVEMLIHGSLKMKCFRDYCEHVNILNYLPNTNEFESLKMGEANQPSPVEQSPSKKE